MSSVHEPNSNRVGLWAVRGGCLGLAAGLIELVVVAGPALVPQTPWPGMFHVSPHWLWLKPLADAAFGCASAAALAVLNRFLIKRDTTAAIVGPVVAILIFAAIFPYWPRLSAGSLAFFAAGAAVPLSRWLSTHLALLQRRGIQSSALIAIALLLAVGGSIVTVPAMEERRGKSLLPPGPAGAPNIVLVVLDTVRAPETAPGSMFAALPSLQRLAAGGAEFDQAFATSSWTLESHASMFTGHYPQEIFTRGETPLNFETPLPGDIPTLAERLRDAGYMTGGFVANTNYASRDHGLNRGFLHYDDYPLTWDDIIASSAVGNRTKQLISRLQGHPVPVGQRSADQVAGSFLKWFDRQEGRPVFAFLNFFDAHDPYVPHDGFRDGDPRRNPRIDPYVNYGPREIAEFKRTYDDCVAYLDRVVGKLTAELERRGALESTVLIVTSDHGELFGEHNLMTHGNSLYRQLLHVPLVVHFPKSVPAGTRVSTAVSLRDMPATLLDLAGVHTGVLPGVSLTPLWNASDPGMAFSPVVSSIIIGREPHRWAPRSWPVSRGSMRSIVADGYHYIRNGDGVEELYDVTNDTNETRNLAGVQALELQRLRNLVRGTEPVQDTAGATAPKAVVSANLKTARR